MAIRVGKTTTWEQWFAWKPVTLVNGKRVWLKRIYRKRMHVLEGGRRNGMWVRSYWIYGTLFNALSDHEAYK